jgi:hypothetical protein
VRLDESKAAQDVPLAANPPGPSPYLSPQAGRGGLGGAAYSLNGSASRCFRCARAPSG